MEKDNSQLKYEVHVLNKELDIRSQEREYERKAVDLASKQHLETVKKIAKLEEECNRLRLLVRKKLPGIRSTFYCIFLWNIVRGRKKFLGSDKCVS